MAPSLRTVPVCTPVSTLLTSRRTVDLCRVGSCLCCGDRRVCRCA